jgi:hypothetical protein
MHRVPTLEANPDVKKSIRGEDGSLRAGVHENVGDRDLPALIHELHLDERKTADEANVTHPGCPAIAVRGSQAPRGRYRRRRAPASGLHDGAWRNSSCHCSHRSAWSFSCLPIARLFSATSALSSCIVLSSIAERSRRARCRGSVTSTVRCGSHGSRRGTLRSRPASPDRGRKPPLREAWRRPPRKGRSRCRRERPPSSRAGQREFP